MRDITLNPEQRLYVIATEGGVTCFGFDNARDHARQIAQRLDRPDLMPTADSPESARDKAKDLRENGAALKQRGDGIDITPP